MEDADLCERMHQAGRHINAQEGLTRKEVGKTPAGARRVERRLTSDGKWCVLRLFAHTRPTPIARRDAFLLKDSVLFLSPSFVRFSTRTHPALSLSTRVGRLTGETFRRRTLSPRRPTLSPRRSPQARADRRGAARVAAAV